MTEAVFDSRLGGRDKHGSQFRDPKTGRFVPKVPCPPHYWLINSQNVGHCKKCGQVKDFGKELKKHPIKSYPYIPQLKEYY
jgi:hypothetical protein